MKAKAFSSPFLIAMVGALALAAVLWQSYRFFGPQPVYSDPTAKPSQTTLWIRDLAKKTGGDVSKLSPEERSKLDHETRGFSEIALKSALKQH